MPSDPESESESEPESESIRSPESESESDSVKPHHGSTPLKRKLLVLSIHSCNVKFRARVLLGDQKLPTDIYVGVTM